VTKPNNKVKLVKGWNSQIPHAIALPKEQVNKKLVSLLGEDDKNSTIEADRIKH